MKCYTQGRQRKNCRGALRTIVHAERFHNQQTGSSKRHINEIRVQVEISTCTLNEMVSRLRYVGNAQHHATLLKNIMDSFVLQARFW